MKVCEPAASTASSSVPPRLRTAAASSSNASSSNTISPTELSGPAIIEALYCENTSRIMPSPNANKFPHLGPFSKLLTRLGQAKDPKYNDIKSILLSYGFQAPVIYICPNINILYLPDMHNLNVPELLSDPDNRRDITAIAINPLYITGMTRNSSMYHIAMLPNLKTVYAVEGREVAYEWLAVDRSINWDIKFVDLPEGEHKQPPRVPYNKGYAAVDRAKWNQMMAPEIAAGNAPELIFKIVEREDLGEQSVKRVDLSGIRILDDNPAPEGPFDMTGRKWCSYDLKRNKSFAATR